MTELVEEKQLSDPDDFIFQGGKTINVRSRTAIINIKVNCRIKKSQVLSMAENFVKSSHMFRKTLAFRTYKKKQHLGKMFARRSIGQTAGSSAINYYIDRADDGFNLSMVGNKRNRRK